MCSGTHSVSFISLVILMVEFLVIYVLTVNPAQ